MLLRFSHVMIYTQKHAESVKWYCEKLGYEIDYHAPGEYTSLHHKQLGRLAIHAVDNPAYVGKGPLPYLLCDDMEKTVKELRAKGIEVAEPERHSESPAFTDFKDFEGNVWGIEEK